MFEFIKRWRERFMCFCFRPVNWDKYITTEAIQERIPEFNPKFCEATYNSSAWWPWVDRESRIKAFDKLIEIYSK